MRQVHRTTALVALVASMLAGHPTGSLAQETNINNQNTNAFQLPGVTLPSGHDEVRASDGTTCRSAVSNSGAYLDVGVIGNPSGDSQQSAYGRIVIPLGQRRSRLDCSQLYALEVDRLRTELRLMKMGLGGTSGMTTGATPDIDEFNDDGWTQDGRN